MKKLLVLSLFALLLNADSSYYEKGELVELQKINESRNLDDKAFDYFTNRNGKKVGLSDELLVQCKESIDCKVLLSKFNLSEISQITDTIFVIKIKNQDNIFLLSRELFESGDVEFAHPNFLKERRLR